MDFNKDTAIFSTGKRVDFNNGIVGLSQELDLFEGYDASVHTHLDKESVDEDFHGGCSRQRSAASWPSTCFDFGCSS